MSKKTILAFVFCLSAIASFAQTNPAITAWLQNNTIFGSYYTAGNSTPNAMTVLANCQQIQYSTTSVYVKTRGIPAYPTGIFSGDGNPNVAGDQNAIYKFPLNPTVNTGTKTPTSAGNIGVFINGVSLFDYRDGVAWNNTTQALCGGPGNPPCPGGMGTTQAWNRDAIPAEKLGFDCAKGHPAGTNYHHHQNPSAFKYDATNSNSYSSICTLYDSEGLYTINTTQHSPLIGFAYDGFPIYGAYAYANTDGTGGIVRMKSGYQLKTATLRTNGPGVGATINGKTFFNGYFREDYEFIAHPNDPSYLDVHNGRVCVTPEYPNGIYCYFATVDANNTSVYPYVVGPTFYGNKTAAKVTSITETVTTYTPTVATEKANLDNQNITIFPNPAQDFITVQVDFVEKDLNVELINELGQVVKTAKILPGSTLAIISTETLYGGIYFVKISNATNTKTHKVVISK